MNKDKPAVDWDYNNRHKQRNIYRAEVIANASGDGVKDVLDVGCNAGYFSKALMKKYPNVIAHGVELAIDAVDKALLEDERFTLFSEDVTKFYPDKKYDVVVYGAVHHHIVAKNGLSVALEVFSRLIESCGKYFFFETGHLTEGSRWYWQRELNRYFTSDEEHLNFLLRSVEKRVGDVDVVGEYKIHGVKRWLLRIAVNQHPDYGVCKYEAGRDDYLLVKTLCRTIGQKRQRLISEKEIDAYDVVKYSLLTEANDSNSGLKFFAKKWPLKTDFICSEALLGMEVQQRAAVRPLYASEKWGLVFHYTEAAEFEKVRELDAAARGGVYEQLNDFFLYITEKHINVPSNLPLYFLQKKPKLLTLIDVIDVNRSNVLLECSKGEFCLRVVDFEFFSFSNKHRNHVSLAKMYMALGYRKEGVFLYIPAKCKMMAQSFASVFMGPRERTIHRRPSFIGYVVVLVRNIIDAFLCRFVSGYCE
jgi:SAM-dependent methyltransferase